MNPIPPNTIAVCCECLPNLKEGELVPELELDGNAARCPKCEKRWPAENA